MEEPSRSEQGPIGAHVPEPGPEGEASGSGAGGPLSPHDLGGSSASLPVLGVLEDVTERAALERRLRDVTQSALVGQLASGIAHRMSNLLAAILGRLDLAIARTGPDGDPRVALDLAKAHECVTTAIALNRHLQTLSWNESSKPALVSLNDLMGDVVARSLAAPDVPVDVEVKPDPALVRVKCDPAHVEEAVSRLVRRALRAMPNGGKLTLATANQDADEAFCRAFPWVRPGRYARLDVHDDGETIPPDLQRRLFEPPATETRRREQADLGLHLVYAIVKGCHGFVHVESRAGEGTAFRVLLPEGR